VEDPVEYQMAGISQVSVKPKVGLTFARCLRSILRQDPDTIMVGEIRDGETAAISIHAALTGHRVFSTLHTNTAAGAVNRLLDMGVEPYLAASALQAVAGQLLVRRLCPHCKKEYKVGQSDWESRYLGLDEPRTLYKAVGCDHCRHTGYAGRLPLQEVLVVTDALRRGISERCSEGELTAIACREGLRPLLEDGKEKVLAGETSCAELLRVLG
jgi:type II secretory ATPase GspE/PulE/Tfp pilus assembly ATPase PilB-like protein